MGRISKNNEYKHNPSIFRTVDDIFSMTFTFDLNLLDFILSRYHITHTCSDARDLVCRSGDEVLSQRGSVQVARI